MILAGVKSVTLQDTKKVSLWDLSAQFYANEEDVGKNRAEACVARLKELNTAVSVRVCDRNLDQCLVAGHSVVVLTDATMEEAKQIDAFCHQQVPAVSFIYAKTAGVFSSVFCDFGPSFTVQDVDGENPHTGIIASISNGYPALVTCIEDERLEFQDGELVTFSEVKGMTEINGMGPVRVKNCKPQSFELDVNTENFSNYVGGGLVTQVKEPKVLDFQPMAQAIQTPGEFLLSDFAKIDRSQVLHLTFQALDKYIETYGAHPCPGSYEDADKFVKIVEKMNNEAKEKVDGLDTVLLKQFALGCTSVLSPMAALVGGIVGQEVVKACSGKFHPLYQWFYFDSAESLPKELLPAEELLQPESRFGAQIAVFGRAIQSRLLDMNCFLVGAGALGCEFLKGFAVMGIACGRGTVSVTDDDTIERSNLSRQFLFRDWNIGQSKSTVAADAARAINPSINIEAMQNRVSPQTENFFNDEFWQGLDVVVNALDNVAARLYVDSRCVYFSKPLLESGTLGTKCNTQMVIPHLTENYGASRDPPEREAPMCTLHSFPHNIDHCLAWARSEFEGMFEQAPAEANVYLEDPIKYVESARSATDSLTKEKVEKVLDCLATNRCSSYEDCLVWARMKFQDYFHDRIAQLVYTFPEDALTSSGTPFWSPPKRFPKPVTFDMSDQAHVMFVRSMANLKAGVYGIPTPEWDESKALAMLSRTEIPEFKPKSGVKIETDPNATANRPALSDESVILNLIDKLEQGSHDLRKADLRLNPVHFEKDDDTNYHMEAITALANMRARNYEITEVDKLKAKFIAGRIIPAIATTTALATGFVCLEIYKVIQSKKIEDYRNAFGNLALPLFALAEPIPPKRETFKDMAWSLWDRWIIEGDVTVQEVLDWLKEKELTAYSISCGQSLIYNNIFPKHKERLNKKMSELVVTIAKLEIPVSRKHFDVVIACEDDEGEDVDVPLVSIKFR